MGTTRIIFNVTLDMTYIRTRATRVRDGEIRIRGRATRASVAAPPLPQSTRLDVITQVASALSVCLSTSRLPNLINVRVEWVVQAAYINHHLSIAEDTIQAIQSEDLGLRKRHRWAQTGLRAFGSKRKCKTALSHVLLQQVKTIMFCAQLSTAMEEKVEILLLT